MLFFRNLYFSAGVRSVFVILTGEGYWSFERLEIEEKVEVGVFFSENSLNLQFLQKNCSQKCKNKAYLYE